MSGDDREKHLSALGKVLQISRDMVATTDLDELLGLIINRTMELLEAERATLFLYDAETDELISRIAAGAREIRFSAGTGIAGAVARSRKTLNVPDVYADHRFNRDVDRQTGFRTRNILAVPLLDYSGQLVGVLEALNKLDGVFGPQDVGLAQTLAAQAGVVLQRARLLEHYVQKQRMEQALAIARQIQQDLLPRENPTAECFDVAGWSRPADETGGDIYDFFDLGRGRWTLMLADATGHGVGPALVVAEARAMLRALSIGSAESLDISAILARVNNLLAMDLSSSRFVTCFFGLLDGPAGTVRYASAGQGPILFYSRARDAFEVLPATELPLGIMEDVSYSENVQRKLAAGDIMAVVTDGFFEACDPQGQQMGVECVQRIIRQARALPAAEIIESLHRAMNQFTHSARQVDDLTAIVAKRDLHA